MHVRRADQQWEFREVEAATSEGGKDGFRSLLDSSRCRSRKISIKRVEGLWVKVSEIQMQ
jgi:hypothetical protein